MAEQKVTAEESFREALKDVVDVAEKLSSFCPSTADLVEMCQLALSNDGQLKLLISQVTQTRR